MNNKVNLVEKIKKEHNFIDRALTIQDYTLENVERTNDKITIINKDEKGIIESPVFETLDFTELVGSWSAITNENSHVEMLVRVRVNGEFSKYFSYGEWGLGYSNLYYNQDDTNVKMSVDEIIVKNDLLANAFQYKIIITNDTSLSLVCITLNIPSYEHKVDTKFLPSIVDYDVPKLNQNIVPEIGHEICSATTTTMLLKFKGLDFTKDDSEFEHRYIASLVADRGHNAPTYGNWVYNTAVLASFGYDAYVARMYSWDELKYHLAKVGPVGASIKGDAVLYKTNGHLIVVRGYKEVNGETFVLCNDPNINKRFGDYFVYYEFPLDVFMKFWRGVAYIIE